MLRKFKLYTLSFLIIASAFIYWPILGSNPSSLQIAQYLGFVGMQLIWWQVVLGSRVLSRYISSDLFSIKNIHKFLGKYGFILILLHPTLMLQTYGQELLLPKFDISDHFVRGVNFGKVGLAFLFLTWFVSAFLRTKISWRNWKKIHLIPYFALPILFLHAFTIGQHLHSTGFYWNWLWFLILSFTLIVVLRLIDFSGELKLPYKLVKKQIVASGVTRFDLIPLRQKIIPLPGQFAYFQMKRFGETHPFTVSFFNPKNNQISFSIKAVGLYSTALRDLKINDTVFIEGPYGVFTREISKTEKPVVVIAGGIGLTPFLRWLMHKKIDYLFYGTQTIKDIVYPEVIKHSKAKAIHVLSDQQKPGYHSGYIDIPLLKKNLGDDLAEYEFFVCGPPVMMTKIMASLKSNHVPKTQIHSERFSL